MCSVAKYCLWLLLALACHQSLFSQESGGPEGKPKKEKDKHEKKSDDAYVVPAGESPFIVRDIVISGNRKTRDNIILRELSFKSGDAYLLQDLVNKFELARQQLMNLALFHEVTVALKSFDGYKVDVAVTVRERWYLFPIPYLRPVDRNLNQWIVEQKASLDRVDYGMKLMYNNATGRNDKLRATIISGYSRQILLNYDRPYIDRKMRLGLSLGMSLGKNREMNYNTIDDKQVFIKDKGYLRNFWRGYMELSYRKAIRTRHRLGIAYATEELADTIVKLNPDYFPGGRKKIAFPELYYFFNYTFLDYIPYPTKGYAAELYFSKKGIDKSLNSWEMGVKGSGNWPMGKKAFFSLNSFATVKLPFDQPYYNRRLLGYSSTFMQGYEYYVVDGVAGGYIKASATRRLLNFNLNFKGTKKIAPLRIPVNIYGRVYGNTGYIYDPQPGKNFLANRMLFSSGIGIDIVTFYDFVFKLDWSFNQLGQNGLFFHRRSIF
jgi:outer membrane protein assembly factor BamA